MREPATVLYAFCRVADDAVDADPHATQSTVDALRQRLDVIYEGAPRADAIDRALAAVVAKEGVPRATLDALLEGLAWDAEGRRYESLEDVFAYAARVAGAVGAMMTVVMGAREPHVLARACDLGVAMQLTNIARDVGEDARRGRLYLPSSWLTEVGLHPDAFLAAPKPSPALASVVERLLAVADDLYIRADAGIAALPRDCQLAIHAARLIYADIGRAVARANFDSVTRRAVVSPWRKLWLLGRAAIASRRRASPAVANIAEPPLGPVRFLVTACAEGS